MNVCTCLHRWARLIRWRVFDGMSRVKWPVYFWTAERFYCEVYACEKGPYNDICQNMANISEEDLAWQTIHPTTLTSVFNRIKLLIEILEMQNTSANSEILLLCLWFSIINSTTQCFSLYYSPEHNKGHHNIKFEVMHKLPVDLKFNYGISDYFCGLQIMRFFFFHSCVFYFLIALFKFMVIVGAMTDFRYKFDEYKYIAVITINAILKSKHRN